MPFFNFSGWLKRFITKFLWHGIPVEFTEADMCQNSTGVCIWKPCLLFFNLVMEDFHSSNSFIYMCQGDQVREITWLYFVTQQLSAFHGSSCKGRRQPARFPNMISSTNFSQFKKNKFHWDPASMASFLSPLSSSLPLPVCWNAHTYFRLPIKHHTPHFFCIDPNWHLIQPAHKKVSSSTPKLKIKYIYENILIDN